MELRYNEVMNLIEKKAKLLMYQLLGEELSLDEYNNELIKLNNAREEIEQKINNQETSAKIR